MSDTAFTQGNTVFGSQTKKKFLEGKETATYDRHFYLKSINLAKSYPKLEHKVPPLLLLLLVKSSQLTIMAMLRSY